MTDLTLHFTLEQAATSAVADPAVQAAEQAALESDLRRIRTVADVAIEPPERVTGVEFLVGITLAGHLVHQAAGIVHDTAAIVHDLKAMIEDVRAMFGGGRAKSVCVSVDMEPKPIDALTEEDYQTMATDIVEARARGDETVSPGSAADAQTET